MMCFTTEQQISTQESVGEGKANNVPHVHATRIRLKRYDDWNISLSG